MSVGPVPYGEVALNRLLPREGIEVKHLGVVYVELAWWNVAACTEPAQGFRPREPQHRSQAQPRPPHPRRRERDASRFRVALVEAESSARRGRGARSCKSRTRTHASSASTMSPLASALGDGVHADPVLERAAEDPSAPIAGHFGGVSGRWPNDALLTTTTPGEPPRSSAYRWESDRWVEIAEWPGVALGVARFDKGLLVDGVRPSRQRTADARRRRLVHRREHRAASPRPSTRPPCTTYDGNGLQDLVGVDDTAFVMGPWSPGSAHLMVERMSAASTPGHLDELSPREGKAPPLGEERTRRRRLRSADQRRRETAAPALRRGRVERYRGAARSRHHR